MSFCPCGTPTPRRGLCRPCDADRKRLAHAMKQPEPVRDIREVAANNAVALWHGPVDRDAPLRWAA